MSKRDELKNKVANLIEDKAPANNQVIIQEAKQVNTKDLTPKEEHIRTNVVIPVTVYEEILTQLAPKGKLYGKFKTKQDFYLEAIKSFVEANR